MCSLCNWRRYDYCLSRHSPFGMRIPSAIKQLRDPWNTKIQRRTIPQLQIVSVRHVARYEGWPDDPRRDMPKQYDERPDDSRHDRQKRGRRGSCITVLDTRERQPTLDRREGNPRFVLHRGIRKYAAKGTKMENTRMPQILAKTTSGDLS